jgi:hypothetical protein
LWRVRVLGVPNPKTAGRQICRRNHPRECRACKENAGRSVAEVSTFAMSAAVHKRSIGLPEIVVKFRVRLGAAVFIL